MSLDQCVEWKWEDEEAGVRCQDEVLWARFCGRGQVNGKGGGW